MALSWPARLSRLFRLVDILSVWRQRAAEQRYLGDLSNYYLRDIGLSRSDVARDATELFWRR